jgi:hypothetical protein
MSFTGCSRCCCCCCEVEEEETEVAIADDGAALEREDDGGALVIFFSVAGDAGATPLGRPLCFARSASARFMVVHGSVVSPYDTIDLVVVGGKPSSPLSSFLPTHSARNRMPHFHPPQVTTTGRCTTLASVIVRSVTQTRHQKTLLLTAYKAMQWQLVVVLWMDSAAGDGRSEYICYVEPSREKSHCFQQPPPGDTVGYRYRTVGCREARALRCRRTFR